LKQPFLFSLDCGENISIGSSSVCSGQAQAYKTMNFVEPGWAQALPLGVGFFWQA
jgi:hypothetical protein